MTSETPDSNKTKLPPDAVERAIRLSYVQSMLGAVYIATTGGLFIIGYALKLGANNAQIGLLSTVPMACVIVQLLSSMLIEKGMSRRRMTIFTAGMSASGWLLIIFLPSILVTANSRHLVTALIGIIALITIFGQIANNARASWVGDLIPSDKRGTFFGKIVMYSGIIGAIFAVVAGLYLDNLDNAEMTSFRWLFLIGMLAGLLNALLFVPQADVPIVKDGDHLSYMSMVKNTFTNKPLMIVTLYAVVWSLQTIAAPFVATYVLRDIRVSFFGFSAVSMIGSLVIILSSSFWGRVIDRYGCRPVLIVCTSIIVPLSLVWIWIDNPTALYITIPFTNIIGGFAIGGITVALSTLVYKVTPDAGRSVQFAVYSVIVLLIAAPMPAIGGHLPDWLESAGLKTDLRATFYATIPITLAAALVARRIKEDPSGSVSQLACKLVKHLCVPSSLDQK
ncbi:MAG: MFS transporter [Armatimonadota bacterium]